MIIETVKEKGLSLESFSVKLYLGDPFHNAF